MRFVKSCVGVSLLFFVSSHSLSANQFVGLYVGSNVKGSASYDPSLPEDHFTDIESAIQASQPNETIFVRDGHHNPPIHLDSTLVRHPVSILGAEEGDRFFIDQVAGEPSIEIHQLSQDVTIADAVISYTDQVNQGFNAPPIVIYCSSRIRFYNTDIVVASPVNRPWDSELNIDNLGIITIEQSESIIFDGLRMADQTSGGLRGSTSRDLPNTTIAGNLALNGVVLFNSKAILQNISIFGGNDPGGRSATNFGGDSLRVIGNSEVGLFHQHAMGEGRLVAGDSVRGTGGHAVHMVNTLGLDGTSPKYSACGKFALRKGQGTIEDGGDLAFNGQVARGSQNHGGVTISFEQTVDTCIADGKVDVLAPFRIILGEAFEMAITSPFGLSRDYFAFSGSLHQYPVVLTGGRAKNILLVDLINAEGRSRFFPTIYWDGRMSPVHLMQNLRLDPRTDWKGLQLVHQVKGNEGGPRFDPPTWEFSLPAISVTLLPVASQIGARSR